MAKSEVDKVTEERIARGGMLAKLYFDMQDADRNKLQPLMVELVNEHLLKERGVIYCFGAIEEPLEREGIFTTSAEVTMLFEGFAPLVNIAFNYAPAGIEIIKPSEMTIKANELQSILMDVSLISTNYSKYILEKVLKPEELRSMKQQLDNRFELGRKLMEKKEEKGKDGKS